MQGTIGATGASGVQGFIGATGASGVQGTIGATGASGINGNIGATGIFVTGYTEKTGNYTISSIDYTINCTANTFTVSLPTASGIQGKLYNIKNTGNGIITVLSYGSETIDGETIQFLHQWDNLQIQSTNIGWIII